jgi:deoxycytidine triphosphate deaminase
VSVYSDIDVRVSIARGQVVCCPLRLENIKGSSVDLTLGENFWRCDANPHGVFNPYDEDEIRRYFAGPFRAKPYASVYRKIGCSVLRNEWPPPAGDSQSFGRSCYSMSHPFRGIPEDWPVIVLRPRERILAHSHEFVGVRGRGTTMLKARSSAGRVGLKVCDDAGWGDPGFVNRWTWEMRNDNDEAVIIPVGERMAQIVFFTTGPVERAYSGKYQIGEDEALEQMITGWTPYDMLPRTFEDERSEPLTPDAEAYRAAVRSLRAEE